MTSHTSIIGHGRRKRGGERWEQHGAPLDAFSRLACQSELELAPPSTSLQPPAHQLLALASCEIALFGGRAPRAHRARTAARSLRPSPTSPPAKSHKPYAPLLPSMTPSPTFPTLRRGIGIGWQGFYTTARSSRVPSSESLYPRRARLLVRLEARAAVVGEWACPRATRPALLLVLAAAAPAAIFVYGWRWR